MSDPESNLVTRAVRAALDRYNATTGRRPARLPVDDEVTPPPITDDAVRAAIETAIKESFTAGLFADLTTTRPAPRRMTLELAEAALRRIEACRRLVFVHPDRLGEFEAALVEANVAHLVVLRTHALPDRETMFLGPPLGEMGFVGPMVTGE